MDVLTWSTTGTAPLVENSPTSGLSNTVCLVDPDGTWKTVQAKGVKELSEYGEVARLDTSLGAVAKCILVTYFDVRSAQKLLMQMAGRAEPFPPAAHDCRSVRVNMVAFASKVGRANSFTQYGEVAHVTMHIGDAIVEFYDIRAAQMLLAAAQGTAVPWMPQVAHHEPGTDGWEVSAAAAPVPAWNFDLAAATSFLGRLQKEALASSLPLLMHDHLAAQAAGLASLLMPPGIDAPPAGSTVQRGESSEDSTTYVMTSESGSANSDTAASQAKSGSDKSTTKIGRHKVPNKEFSKYDICPEALVRGADPRTTVMVRHLAGDTVRKDFLNFLDKCGLGDRYTFCYMPPKEHRKVLAGYAFVNFVSPADVNKLWVALNSNLWHEMTGGKYKKVPIMSYARFQGHDELEQHFHTSAVLHEADPDKRPIFRLDAGKGDKASPKAAGAALPVSIKTKLGGLPAESPQVPMKGVQMLDSPSYVPLWGSLALDGVLLGNLPLAGIPENVMAEHQMFAEHMGA